MQLQFRPDPARKLSANLYGIHIAVCTVKTADDGQRNCPKHVEFYSINKFEKLVHLVSFIIRKPNKVVYLLYLYRPWIMSCVVRYVHHSHSYLYHFLP